MEMIHEYCTSLWQMLLKMFLSIDWTLTLFISLISQGDRKATPKRVEASGPSPSSSSVRHRISIFRPSVRPSTGLLDDCDDISTVIASSPSLRFWLSLGPTLLFLGSLSLSLSHRTPMHEPSYSLIGQRINMGLSVYVRRRISHSSS